ncbi:MAG: helix-turn-helix domain-containing protein [Acidimicrobiales bacterium]
MARRTYGQFCPIGYSLDLLGERWTLLIVRELASGPRRFTDLRTNLAGVAPNLLTDRLRALEAAGIVTTRELPPPAARTVYTLTEHGSTLRPALYELARWGLGLLGAPGADEHFPTDMVPDALRAMVRTEEVPDYGVVIAFDLDEGAHAMTVTPRAPRGERCPTSERIAVESVDIDSPGRGATEATDTGTDDPTLTVTASLTALLWLRTGAMAPAELRSQGLITLRGGPSAVRDFAHMWGVDPADLATTPQML